MHVRRAILLFALVLGLTALAAAVSPTRETSPPAESGGQTVPRPTTEPRAQEVVFEVRAPGAKPTVARVGAGDRVVVSVESGEGGLVTIPRLGRTDPVTASTPARFDLLAPAPGRYDVLFATSGLDEPRRVGTLITRR